MKTSSLSAVVLGVILIAAAWDGGRTSIVYAWIPWVSVVVACWLACRTRESRRAVTCMLWPALVLVLLFATYALNPTHRWEPGVGLLPLSPLPYLPGSAHAERSWHALAVVACALAAFVLGCLAGRRTIRWVQWAAMVGGGGMAAVVLNQRLTPRRYPIFEITGTFPYENHYAAFANLLLPVVLTAALRFEFRAVQKGMASSPAGLCYLSAVLIAASILLSGSRAAVLWMCLSLAGWLVISWRIKKTYEYVSPSRTRLRSWAWGLCAGGAVSSLLYLVYRVWSWMPDWRREAAFRGRILGDTWAIWRDNPWWGGGPGTFVSVIPYYQSESLQAYHLAHAHCEPLQFLAELGLLGSAICLMAACTMCLCARRVAPPPLDDWPRFRELEGPGFALGLATLLLHSMVDFPLRMPALAWIAAAWCGLLAAQWEKRKGCNLSV